MSAGCIMVSNFHKFFLRLTQKKLYAFQTFSTTKWPMKKNCDSVSLWFRLKNENAVISIPKYFPIVNLFSDAVPQDGFLLLKKLDFVFIF